jgi:hypothetical protein
MNHTLAFGILKCPYCKKPWKAGHPCEGDSR